MSLLDLIIVLVIVGIILWLINTYVPMDAKIKSVLNIAVVVIVVLWIVQSMGFLGTLQNIQVK